jgi:hypothetical protein
LQISINMQSLVAARRSPELRRRRDALPMTDARRDERTRLRVGESGHELRDWPDAEKQRYASAHSHGGVEYLDRLAKLSAERRPE